MSAAGVPKERPFHVPDDARATQDAVSDPRVSAWVTANAGSGKTFVLTRRVLRLLLDGAAPETILCLTYTKAAAAEMRHRVGAELARWALAESGELAEALAGTLGRTPSTQEASRARSLFARALETPGGLKIQTIHAFCEAVLQRFPYEAGVPVDFAVIEDANRVELMNAARESVLAEGLKGDAALKDAVGYLFVHLSDHQITAALDWALQGGRRLDPILRDPQKASTALQTFLELGDDDALERFRRAVLEEAVVPVSRYPDILAVCPATAEGSRFEDKIARIDRTSPDINAILGAFLTKNGTVPKNFPKSDFRKANPVFADALLAEAERLASLYEKMRAATIAEQSGALLTVLCAVVRRFEAQKRARSLLDFDDLIARTNALFADPTVRDWVRYKLDAGIDHILVDESQDTNRAQWEVIDALADDFFSGEGAARRPKTLFAVGDPKQSIYSFQGAEPELFIEKGEQYGHRALAAGAPFVAGRLRTSFRTLEGVLEGVDVVANRPAVSAALLSKGEAIRHESARLEKGGTIEIWPAAEEPKLESHGEVWPLTPPENPFGSAARQVAQRIVRQIQDWTSQPTPLAGRGRAIRPDDILILVRSRNEVFAELVGQLRKADIESPGADQLPVSAHIVVDDLLGLADVLANPADDLLLAAVLRSPLFDVSEDDLFDLAAPRGKATSLWSALARSELPGLQSAYMQLNALRRALDYDRPYAFFAHVLYARGGLKAFRARLGPEVDEVIAEFLDLALEHENADQPSLTGFVARMRASDITVKRDLVAKTAGVRVMTVHGAKGLEAPIVILADAASTPPSTKQQVYFSEHEGVPFFLYCPGKNNLSARAHPLREAVDSARQQEYWRNLYVGMTRAEDLLLVAGKKPGTNGKAESWHSALTDALSPMAVASGEGENAALKYQPHPGPPAPIRASAHLDRAALPPPMPPMPAKSAVRVVSPSRFDLDQSEPLVTAGDAVHDARTARLRGVAIHAMLEHLTGVPPTERAAVALNAARILVPHSAELAEPLAAEALAILENPAFASIFGPDSRGEVAFALEGAQNGAPIRLVGRFDRVVVSDDWALVVDFKSDADPAATPQDVGSSYRVQLGLYKKAAERLFSGRAVSVAILWTATATVMELEESSLERAVEGVTLA